uniref:Uncharacterized protein n=1 Tax=Amphora coffeiformis TaxID=265554 RepID=A0A7S3P5Q7_9STRA|mmetsp:Transcript_12834/g.24670  ORF Transcript_12834/g.24670 Transcript_12834/m.24670 type:complete len:112 (+) Transcript_12834:289-624(+)
MADELDESGVIYRYVGRFEPPPSYDSSNYNNTMLQFSTPPPSLTDKTPNFLVDSIPLALQATLPLPYHAPDVVMKEALPPFQKKYVWEEPTTDNGYLAGGCGLLQPVSRRG